MKTISRYIMTLALLITAVGGAWAQTETLLTTITPSGKDTYSETTAGVVTVTPSNMRRYSVDYGWLWVTSGSVTVEAKEGYTITKCVFKQNAKNPVTITTSPFAITFDERGHCVQNDDMDGVTSIEVYGNAPAPAEPPIKVTTNAAEEGATFTEASFTMPDYDATVGFDIVRDMSEQMTTKVGDAADGADYRIRLRKKDNAWELADIELADLKALITVTDGIENENLACFGQDAVCTLQIFAIDDNDQPTGDPISFADLEPGRYKAKAVAKADGDYIGETGLSNVIVLFQGYEVKVPAKEMITYYKDEPLYADTETSGDAELYTISSVSGDQVVLSDAIETAPSYTPLLVYNKGDQDKTFLLIPVDAEPNLALTVFSGFKGTLVARTTDDTSDDYGPWNMAEDTKYYGCNGNDFVWIKTDGNVDAHRCWIEISTANAPSRLTIVFEKEGTTDIVSMEDGRSQMEDGAWYDLSGRKLDGEPTAKGVYIKDGKKVVVR